MREIFIFSPAGMQIAMSAFDPSPVMTPEVPDADSPSGGSALTRMLQILGMFSVERPAVTVEDVVEAFGVGQSTSYRYLRELSDAGLIASQGKGVYGLGRRIVELDRLLQRSDPLLLAGKKVMRGFEELCDNRAFLLCAPYNDRVLCVHHVGMDKISVEGTSKEIERGRGTSFSLFRGAGSQVLLAHLPPHQIKSLYLTSAAEIAAAGLGASWKEFRTSLSQIRKQGYGRTLGRTNPGMYSLAVPILKTDGKVAGSLLLLGATAALEEGMALLPAMLEQAAAVAVELAD
jgi:DNA-binding IclR family transcriptional regulator